jgi:hypothetical protein
MKKLYFENFTQTRQGNIVCSFDMFYNKKKHFAFVYDMKIEKFITSEGFKLDSYKNDCNYTGVVGGKKYSLSVYKHRSILTLEFNGIPFVHVLLDESLSRFEEKLREVTKHNRLLLMDYVDIMQRSKREKQEYWNSFNTRFFTDFRDINYSVNYEKQVKVLRDFFAVSEESKQLILDYVLGKRTDEIWQKLQKFNIKEA